MQLGRIACGRSTTRPSRAVWSIAATEVGSAFTTSPVPYLAVGGGYYQGTAINYSPPGNQGPGPVDISSPNVNVELKPFNDCRFAELIRIYALLRSIHRRRSLRQPSLISRWNHQLTKAGCRSISIGEYIATLP